MSTRKGTTLAIVLALATLTACGSSTDETAPTPTTTSTEEPTAETSTSIPPEDDDQGIAGMTKPEIIETCKKKVKAQLKAPATAVFDADEEATYWESGIEKAGMRGTIDSQNSFGALLRSKYKCTAEWVDGDIKVSAFVY